MNVDDATTFTCTDRNDKDYSLYEDAPVADIRNFDISQDPSIGSRLFSYEKEDQKQVLTPHTKFYR